MNYSLTAFQEPRGVMRILQLVSLKKSLINEYYWDALKHFFFFSFVYTQIFAIVAFSTTANFSVDVDFTCVPAANSTSKTIEYPFRFRHEVCIDKSTKEPFPLAADVSSDAQVETLTNIVGCIVPNFEF